MKKSITMEAPHPSSSSPTNTVEQITHHGRALKHSLAITVRDYFSIVFFPPLSLSLRLLPYCPSRYPLCPLSPCLTTPAAAPTQPAVLLSSRVATASTSARCLPHPPPSPLDATVSASSPLPLPPLLLRSHSSAGAPQAHASCAS